eukprot:89285-Chlamydomonas_euryale.AAC.6
MQSTNYQPPFMFCRKRCANSVGPHTTIKSKNSRWAFEYRQPDDCTSMARFDASEAGFSQHMQCKRFHGPSH